MDDSLRRKDRDLPSAISVEVTSLSSSVGAESFIDTVFHKIVFLNGPCTTFPTGKKSEAQKIKLKKRKEKNKGILFWKDWYDTLDSKVPNDVISFEVYDNSGLIKSFTFSGNNNGEYDISFPDYLNGSYEIRVSSGDNTKNALALIKNQQWNQVGKNGDSEPDRIWYELKTEVNIKNRASCKKTNKGEGFKSSV